MLIFVNVFSFSDAAPIDQVALESLLANPSRPVRQNTFECWLPLVTRNPWECQRVCRNQRPSDHPVAARFALEYIQSEFSDEK